MGADGLRAGWGVLLFVLLYVVFLFFIGWVLRPFLLAARHVTVLPVRLALIIESHNSCPTILATAIMAFIEPPSASRLRISGHGQSRALPIRPGLGFIALSAFVLILWKARLLAFDGELLHGGAILKYALGWGLCS